MRLEQDQTPVFYVPAILRDLEQPRPRYLVGTRGSGKTTLLRAMHWKERLGNASLRNQVGPDPFHDRYLGLYLKVPEVQLVLLDRWLDQTDDDTMAGLFSTYLESTWLQLAVRAVLDFIAHDRFRIEPQQEWDALDEAATHLDQFSKFGDLTPRLTLVTLRNVLAGVQRHLEACARSNADPNLVAGEVPADVGLLGRVLAPALTSLCRQYLRPTENDRVDDIWRLHVCLDEAESMSERQQLALNTIVRLSESPVYYLASFVGRPADMVSTYKPNLTLASADLDVTNRDNIPTDEFNELVQGVVQGRADAVLGHGAVTVDLKTLLGTPTLNELMARRLATSESKATADLIADARKWAAVKADSDVGEVTEEIPALPLWQAYAIHSRFGEIPNLPPEEIRQFESRFVRKVRASAYLKWHRERRINRPLYAGWDIFTSVADSCVRDFLWQMDALLTATTPSRSDAPLADVLHKMFEHTRDYERQSQALYRASDAKLDRITQVMTTAPEPARQLVTRLGELLRNVELQRDVLDAEPGRFQFAVNAPDEVTRQAVDLVRRSAEAGYLKLEVSEPVWTFRLHSSLAPHFKLSWRDAYRIIKFSAQQILDMATSSSAEVRNISSQRLSAVRNQLDGQVELEFTPDEDSK